LAIDGLVSSRFADALHTAAHQFPNAPVLQADRAFMTSDEELRHALDALGDRLRETVTREVKHVAAQVAAPPVPTARTGDLDAARLLEGMRSIDRARSLSAILDALRASAEREASRVTILFVRGSGLTGNGAPELRQTGILAEAVRRRSTASQLLFPSDGSPVFGVTPIECMAVAVPITLAGEVVAVLYAERDGTSLPHEAAALEALTLHASRCLEAVTAFKAAAALAKLKSEV
jgi:hypothetical protein